MRHTASSAGMSRLAPVWAHTTCMPGWMCTLHAGEVLKQKSGGDGQEPAGIGTSNATDTRHASPTIKHKQGPLQAFKLGGLQQMLACSTRNA